MNDVDEINEENNEGKIENIKVTCSGKLLKNTGQDFIRLMTLILVAPWGDLNKKLCCDDVQS